MEATAWSDTRPDRSERTDCTICDATDGTPCWHTDDHTDGWHVGRRWEIGITWPGARFGAHGQWHLDGVCRATVEDCHVPHPDPDRSYRIIHRGACLGCGWAGPVHDDSNPAIDDALDHTLPGWRQVPIVERHHYDANTRQVEAWATEIARLYASYGLDDRLAPGNGGVIRTMRQPRGTRSHHTARGYYDICGDVTAPTPAPARGAVTEQLGLF